MDLGVAVRGDGGMLRRGVVGDLTARVLIFLLGVSGVFGRWQVE